jgi:hypothetical protein
MENLGYITLKVQTAEMTCIITHRKALFFLKSQDPHSLAHHWLDLEHGGISTAGNQWRKQGGHPKHQQGGQCSLPGSTAAESH